MKKFSAIFIVVLIIILLYVTCFPFHRLNGSQIHLNTDITISWNRQNFKKIPFPKIGTDDWYFLNYASIHFVLDKEMRSVSTNINYKKISEKEMKIDNGKFLYVDRGEWGGKIEFIPIYGNSYLILDETSVIDIILFQNKYYFITPNKIYELKNENEMWTYELAFSFDPQDDYETYLLDGDDLYIFMNDKLIRFQNNLQNYEVILNNAYWEQLMPLSVAKKENIIYIGNRAGISTVDLKNNNQKFYVYKSFVK